jgi:hypothetical protein
VLSSDLDDYSNDNNNMGDKEDLIETICLTLNMTEDQLSTNTGKTILSTARQIIGAKYPDPATIFANVEKEHIQAVIGEFF